MSAKKFEWQPLGRENIDLVYSDAEKDAERRCIGHLRGDFGRGGKEFYTTWFPHAEEFRTPAFGPELDEVVNDAREKGGLLASLSSMSSNCYKLESTPSKSWNTKYCFKLETEQHKYCLRCNPARGDYNFYLYCYDKGTARDSVLDKLGEMKSKTELLPKAEKQKEAER